MAKAQRLTSVKQLQGYENLVISGGEPMLFPDRVINLAKVLHKAAPQAKIFLYTAFNRNNKDIERVLPHIDGINYTVHTDSEQDAAQFQGFQALASRWKDKAFRLYVEKPIADKLVIIPGVWERIKTAPWMTEPEMIKAGGCPEDLFILAKEPRPTKANNAP